LIASFVAIADLLPNFPARGEQDQRNVVEVVKRCLLRRVSGLASHLSVLQVLEYASDECVNEAGHIVIALAQAGAYIEETGCSLPDSLAIYSTHRKELLARRGIQATRYPDSVATTWSISFQKVEQASSPSVHSWLPTPSRKNSFEVGLCIGALLFSMHYLTHLH